MKMRLLLTVIVSTLLLLPSYAFAQRGRQDPRDLIALANFKNALDRDGFDVSTGATTIINPVASWCAGTPIPGYDTALFKAFAFTTGALFASLGGAIYSLQVGLITPTLVGVVASVEMVIYAAVGGRTSVVGAVYGALLVGFSKSLFSENFPTLWLFFIGGLFIFVVLAMPNGLAGILGQLAARRSARTAS